MANNLLDDLVERISRMRPAQLQLVASMVSMLERPVERSRNPESDVITGELLEALGDHLKLHHCLSADYLDKARFEAAFARLLSACGRQVARPANRCNPGHDLTVDGVPWSVKTQGDRGIREDELHISKFMELGKGSWSNSEQDLAGLRDQFLRHMRSYRRIFQLRYFDHAEGDQGTPCHRYELVEIPKSLLNEARAGKFRVCTESRQSPKPGYCTISDREGQTKFELYFDGGTERKLQIKHIRKSLCVVHATWRFDR